MALVKEGLLCVEFGEYDEAIENYDKSVEDHRDCRNLPEQKTELSQKPYQCYEPEQKPEPEPETKHLLVLERMNRGAKNFEKIQNKGVVLTDIDELDEAYSAMIRQ